MSKLGSASMGDRDVKRVVGKVKPVFQLFE